MMNLYHGDCLEIVQTLEAGSVDAIITDLPYGTTACKWDTIIPFDELWKVVRYVLKQRGAFITTASQPFTSALVMSNPENFSDEWIWDKKFAGVFANCKTHPLKIHENIIVFYGRYFPQMEKRITPIKSGKRCNPKISSDKKIYNAEKKVYDSKYPVTILNYPRKLGQKTEHPTQKPVALYEYLIKTYTNEDDTVLDICMGSGTTGVACKNTGRNFIGIEKDADYFAIAEKRINET